MKKTILTLVFSGLITVAFAQIKSKPVYSLDTSKTVQITLNISVNKLNDFLVTEQRGPQSLIVAKDLSGYQINQMAFHYKAVLDSVNSAFTSFIKKDQEKFKADTTALYHKK